MSWYMTLFWATFFVSILAAFPLLFFFFWLCVGELFITHICTCNERNHKCQTEGHPQPKLQTTLTTLINNSQAYSQMPQSQTQTWRHLLRHNKLHHHHHLPHTTATWQDSSH